MVDETIPQEETKHQKIMSRVRALLAKADSTTEPGEAERFREGADKLMTLYAIEQWQLDAHKDEPRAVKPIRRDFDMKWYMGNPLRNDLWAMMSNVAAHCRVKLVYWKFSGFIPAVGITSDLDYFDMLFTTLMLELGKGLEPKPKPDVSLVENLVVLREAGMTWNRAADLLEKIDQCDTFDTKTGMEWTKLYTAYCREHNRARVRTTPSVYQASYAKGFVTEIRKRLRRQEEKSTGSMELVLRDIREVVEDEAAKLFGADPERYAMEKSGYVDPAAYHAGSVDGKKARIAMNPNETMEHTARAPKEIES